MIRLTKVTDYGIVLLTSFARAPEGTVRAAAELSTSTGIPSPMVSKVLKILAREELLISHRGVRGGYTLSRRPEDITVVEIISALEGPIAMTECTGGVGSSCQQESLCPVRGHWHVINHAITEALESLTLEHLAQPEPGRLGGSMVVLAEGARTLAGERPVPRTFSGRLTSEDR